MTLASKLAIPSPGLSSNDAIYEKIYTSILEHRLLPGTKLAEERLAAIFKVSRTRIRDVIGRLAHEQVVEVFPNRGAYIAKPTVDQAQEVFEARRVIEPAIMQRLATTATVDKVARLEAHVTLELEAGARGDRRTAIRLSGEFHNLAADLAGNTMLARSLRELATLTCLIILLYEAPTSASCRPDEHAAITDAVKAGDGGLAATVMLRHLAEIEGTVDLFNSTEDVDLEKILG